MPSAVANVGTKCVVIGVKALELLLGGLKEPLEDGLADLRPHHEHKKVAQIACHATKRVVTKEPTKELAVEVFRHFRLHVDAIECGHRCGEQVDVDTMLRNRHEEDKEWPRAVQPGIRLTLKRPSDWVHGTEGEDDPSELRSCHWRHDHGVRPYGGEENRRLFVHVPVDAVDPVPQLFETSLRQLRGVDKGGESQVNEGPSNGHQRYSGELGREEHRSNIRDILWAEHAHPSPAPLAQGPSS
eukprot:CAMPEP_0119070660 /NCGR_PEP_ID=MMETSP1178-20130426/42865_1 /TAXON_ID=33656 /ORGANISM="unid sp, Strain CCMP2000" /LENGTH=241 /DNA_ID=CAMNT_0007052513 /DNA_START=275 /DNA_END=998 /DNA_ORIENTATION=-